jgi:hypothetical protein
MCDPLTGAGCKNLTPRFEAISLVARAVRAFCKIQRFRFQNFQQTVLDNERCVPELLHLTEVRWRLISSTVKSVYFFSDAIAPSGPGPPHSRGF